MMAQSTAPRIHDTITSEVVQPGNVRIHPPTTGPRLLSIPKSPSEEGGGIKIFSYLKYRWVMILFLGGAIASILGITAWKVIPSKYTTYAMIRISVETPTVYGSEHPLAKSDFVTYLKTQADMIRSWQVLNGAIRDPSVAELQMLRDQTDPIKFLEEELRLEFKEGSEIVKMLLTGEDPRAITMIVNSILDAYDREVVQEELKSKQARLNRLLDEIQKAQMAVNRMYGNRKTLKDEDQKPNKEEPTLINPQLAMSQVLQHKQTLHLLEAEINSALSKKQSLEAQMSNIGSEVKLDSFLLDQIDKEPKMVALSKDIEYYQKQLNYNLHSLGAKLDNPVVMEKRQKLAEATEVRNDIRNKRIAEIEKAQAEVASKRITGELENVRSHLISLNFRKEQHQKLANEYQQIADNPLGIHEKPPDFYRNEIIELEGIIKGMTNRANQLRVEISAPPRVRRFPAAIPVKKEIKKQLLGTAAAIFFGFALVGFLVVVHEAKLQRALSLEEVQQKTIAPVLGVIPSSGRSGPNIRAVEEGKIAEAIDKMRILVQQQFDRGGSKLLMICSSLQDEGRTFLSQELAKSCTRTGAKVLLVDFDLRTPSLHKRFNLVNEKGICETLRKEIDWQSALQVLPDGTSLLTAGQWSDALRNELTPERLVTLFSRFRDHFDFIVMNTHPMLTVSETYVAARWVDSVLLVVEKYESRIPLVTRTQEKIAGLSPESFGIVFLGASEEECLT
jgi:polysaccharide biosynthesis transport protein